MEYRDSNLHTFAIYLVIVQCMALLIAACAARPLDSQETSADTNNEPQNSVTSLPSNSTETDPEPQTDIFSKPVVRNPERKFRTAITFARDALATDIGLKPDQRNPNNYSMEVRQDARYIFVLFSPRIIGEKEGSGETELARDLYYVIRKSDNRLVMRKFFK